MSRGVIYTATYRSFLNGELVIDVPNGYNRIQFNQFTAGAVKEIVDPEDGTVTYWGWLYEGENDFNAQRLTAGATAPLFITQRCPITRTYSPTPHNSLILKVFCEGIDTQSTVVMAGAVGDTVTLGMNGNPYKITNRTIRIYITDENDLLVNNMGVVLQYTFI